MDKLVRLFAQLALLRIGPQDLPFDPALERFVVVGYFLIGIFVSLLVQETPGYALISAGIDTGMMILLTYLALMATNRIQRRCQTLSALAGSGLLITIISIPLVALYSFGGGAANEIISLMLLGLALWNVTIIGHILRYTFDIPLIAGIAIAIIYMYLSFFILQQLLPGNA